MSQMFMLREFRTLVPVVQQLFFWRPVYTEKEDLQGSDPLPFTTLLNRSAGYPMAYALQSYYPLRPTFHYKANSFQTAVQEFQSLKVPLHSMREEDKQLIHTILNHWSLHGDKEANHCSYIILETEGRPKLIAENIDVKEATNALCKVIHLPSLREQVRYEQYKQEDRCTKNKNRFLMVGSFVGFLSISYLLR